MRFRRAQSQIFLVFAGSLLLGLALAVVSYARGQIYAEDLREISVRFLAVYSAPLGIIISGSLGRVATDRRSAPTKAFWTAMALAITWNALILGRTLLFAFGKEDRVTWLIDYVGTVASAGSFLTAATLTYFFAADQPGSRHDQPQQ